MPIAYVDLTSQVLSPLRLAVVSSIIELVPEEGAEMIAEDGSGAAYCYDQEGTSECEGGAARGTVVWSGHPPNVPSLAE